MISTSQECSLHSSTMLSLLLLLLIPSFVISSLKDEEKAISLHEPLEEFHAKMSQLDKEMEESGKLTMDNEREKILKERLEV